MAAARVSKPRVLIVEDDPATLEYLTLLLQNTGYAVTGNVTGADALSTASSLCPEAILLDQRLPDADGIMLTREIREHMGMEIPIIIMTADAESGLMAAAHAAGATQLLRKPFMPRTLLDALAVGLSHEQQNSSGTSSADTRKHVSSYCAS